MKGHRKASEKGWITGMAPVKSIRHVHALESCVGFAPQDDANVGKGVASRSSSTAVGTGAQSTFNSRLFGGM